MVETLQAERRRMRCISTNTSGSSSTVSIPALIRDIQIYTQKNPPKFAQNRTANVTTYFPTKNIDENKLCFFNDFVFFEDYEGNVFLACDFETHFRKVICQAQMKKGGLPSYSELPRKSQTFLMDSRCRIVCKAAGSQESYKWKTLFTPE
eukprot:Pgem_evm1s11261